MIATSPVAGANPQAGLLLADAPQIGLALDENASAGERGGSVVIAVVEVIFGDDLELWVRLDDIAFAGTSEIDAAVGRGNGAGAGCQARRFQFVNQIAIHQRPAA